MKNKIIVNIDFLPPEAIGELKEFQKKFDEKYWGCMITETLKYEMNYDLHCFEKYLKDNYDCPELRCKLNSELGFHEEWWTVKKLCEIYKKYYPERYIKKEKYTKREVNNMLFNLQIIDVVDNYSPIYLYTNSEMNDPVQKELKITSTIGLKRNIYILLREVKLWLLKLKKY